MLKLYLNMAADLKVQRDRALSELTGDKSDIESGRAYGEAIADALAAARTGDNASAPACGAGCRFLRSVQNTNGSRRLPGQSPATSTDYRCGSLPNSRILGWNRPACPVNHKKLFRLYRQERLAIRRRGGRKRAIETWAPMMAPMAPNDRWLFDFVSNQLTDRRFRT